MLQSPGVTKKVDMSLATEPQQSMETEIMGRVLCETVVSDHNSLHTEQDTQCQFNSRIPASGEEEREQDAVLFICGPPIGLLREHRLPQGPRW